MIIYQFFYNSIDKCCILLYTVIWLEGEKMNFIISNSSSEPIYEQIKKEIKKSIINNELKENSMLPSIRCLAKDLRISILTVKKAYDELEQEGYLKTIQGKGSFVISRNKELVKEEQVKRIEELLEKSIQIAKITDISKKQLIELLDYLYED